MKITDDQLNNPNLFDYDKKRHVTLSRFKEAVRRALFLNDDEKRHWIMLGYILSNAQLAEAETLIINEDLRRLHTKQKLERIKPTPKK